MSVEIDLNRYIRKCISIITFCIILVFCAIGSVFTYVTFFGEEGVDVRAIHMQQHENEGEKLDSMISLLESINSKLDGDVE